MNLSIGSGLTSTDGFLACGLHCCNSRLSYDSLNMLSTSVLSNARPDVHDTVPITALNEGTPTSSGSNETEISIDSVWGYVDTRSGETTDVLKKLVMKLIRYVSRTYNPSRVRIVSVANRTTRLLRTIWHNQRTTHGEQHSYHCFQKKGRKPEESLRY